MSAPAKKKIKIVHGYFETNQKCIMLNNDINLDSRKRKYLELFL